MLKIERVFYQLNKACSMVTMIGLACSCIELVLFSFMGINFSFWNDYVKNILGAVSSMLELLALCWFSQTLSDNVSKRLIFN